MRARDVRLLALILAGGEGTRLQPLTRDRAKPAVPFGGRYRLIDFVLSNFVNSGYFQVKVLTQYKASSLITPGGGRLRGTAGGIDGGIVGRHLLQSLGVRLTVGLAHPLHILGLVGAFLNHEFAGGAGVGGRTDF
jgi:hypothetical protein